MEKLSKILYNDKFVELHNDKLVIKTYYFPIGTNKIISIKNIRCIYFKNQADTILYTKGWGLAITVWWGCDMKRQFPSTKTNFFNVALDCGTFIKQGFTVVDIHKFLKALRPLTNAPMENRFPNAFEKRDKLVEVEKEEDSEEKINKNDESFKSMEDVSDICESPPSYDQAVGSSTSSKNIFS